MASGRLQARTLGHLQTLFGVGAIGRLSDGQLLDRFLARRDEVAEAAFAALVERHGPMVLRTCRGVLRDPHDAQDALQATFFVLARRAGSIRRKDSVASWLYGVACRVSARARGEAARRRAFERRAAELNPRAVESERPPQAWPELFEEVERLPEKFRAPIVLIDLEGCTQQEAAERLRWPLGTVQSRLARGRGRLKARLLRRGLVPTAGLVAAMAGPQVASAMPAALVDSIVKAATAFAAGSASSEAAPPAAAALAKGVLQTMLMLKWTTAATLAAVCLVGAGAITHLAPAARSSDVESGPTAAVGQGNARKPKAHRAANIHDHVRLLLAILHRHLGFDQAEARAAASPAADAKDKADKSRADKPDRAERLNAIREEYAKAREEFGKAIQAGTIKPDADGEYPGWAELAKRFTKQAHGVIDADATDAVGLEALLFCLCDLGAGESEPALYQLVLKHHAASEKIDPLVRQRSAPEDFLRGVAAQSPNTPIRLWANYHQAEALYRDGKPKEAEPLLEALKADARAKDFGGYQVGTLADTATRLLFEIRRLNVGQEAPEIDGADLDGKPIKLSQFRGKVTLLVFWATWCGPCMAMVPHERALAVRFAGKPFTVVGVNGDTLPMKDINVMGPDGKPIDDSARVKAALEKHKISWRSFRSGNIGVAAEWNVRSWPTVYLIDDRGIIRGKWKGDPGAKELDPAVEALVKTAVAEQTNSAE